MINDILNRNLFGNSVFDYIGIIVLVVIGMIVVKLFEKIIVSRLKKLSTKTATTVDDFLIEVIQKCILPVGYFAVIYLSLKTLYIQDALKNAIDKLAIAVVIIYGVKFLLKVIDYGLDIYWKVRKQDLILKKSLTGIVMVLRVVVWGLAIVFFLDNLGFNISALIAGLGIGGVAVALAAQAVLGDLFSYFSILFDRPFEIGDFIITGDFLGTVEHVGIKTTRIRSLGGEQVIFSNTDLTNSRVRNYKRMQKRRVVFKLGVTYQTLHDKLQEIPKIIETTIKSIDDTIFDRAHFSSYGDFSLDFEIVYYVLSSDYNKYMDIQQKINLGIHKEFENKKIEFAYPTQTLFMNKT